MEFKSTENMKVKTGGDPGYKVSAIRVKLTIEQYSELNRSFPLSKGSGDIGKRAVEIVKIHWKDIDPGCRFANPPKGADLAVVFSSRADLNAYEIKGTASVGLAWPQLNVSSETSYRLLV